MPVIRHAEAPVFKLPNAPGVTFTGLASPKRGAQDVSTWRVRIEGGTPGAPHSVTREEVFVAIAGGAVFTIDGKEHRVATGDAIVVPSHTRFSLANPGPEAFEAVVVFPVGGQAVIEGVPPFTPPWAE